VALHAVPDAPPVADAARDARDARVYLHVEDARADGGVWEVRVEGDGDAAVGTIAFPERATGGQRFLFDITDAVLGAAGRRELAIRFEPAVPAWSQPTAHVGRVFVTRG
jgi:hypothetical protein